MSSLVHTIEDAAARLQTIVEPSSPPRRGARVTGGVAVLRFRLFRRVAPLLLLAVATGCSAVFEDSVRSDLERDQSKLGPERGEGESHGPPVHFSGKLDHYVRYALEYSPALRAAYDEWDAASFRISPARRLPDPIITYSYFIQSVETRVGPQRHRLSVSQAFPWPTKLTAGADAASLAAKSAQRRYQATGLSIARRVAEAYWKLWVIARTRRVLRDQLEIVRYLSGAARGRLEVSQTGIADVAQVNLRLSRVTDSLSGLDESEQQASAALVAVTGAPPGTATPVDDAPPLLREPAESDEELRAAAAAHPQIESLELMARSRVESADSVEAEGYPSFMAGFTWIETGETSMPNVADSGKDPLIISLGVSLPIWRGAYADKEAQARAEGAMFRAKKSGALDDALAKLAQILAALRDAVRRVRLYRHTLVPQAEAVYGSVLGGYQTGQSTVAAGLLAQRELLELQLGLFRAQGEHATAWARLEEIVGRHVRSKEIE